MVFIREQVRNGAWNGPDSYGCLHVMTEDMAELFYSVRERYGDNWGNEARSRVHRAYSMRSIVKCARLI